jgi:hypothetical protein
MPTVTASNISDAWKQVVLTCLSGTKHETYALTVEIDCTNQLDDPDFRSELNRVLTVSRKATVETVAGTIFPWGLWNPSAHRSQLYSRYLAILPKLRKCPLNHRGIYFERLIQYPLERKATKVANQLEFIINTYVNKSNHRRSALQASLFNPFIDATNSPRLGFPCLQQVGFVPIGGHDLDVVAFYPLHYIFERGYGNYLGLAHLGHFMAQEMRLKLNRVVCVAGVAHFEAPSKVIRSLNLSQSDAR